MSVATANEFRIEEDALGDVHVQPSTSGVHRPSALT
jgi:hypothetical protein